MESVLRFDDHLVYEESNLSYVGLPWYKGLDRCPVRTLLINNAHWIGGARDNSDTRHVCVKPRPYVPQQLHTVQGGVGVDFIQNNSKHSSGTADPNRFVVLGLSEILVAYQQVSICFQLPQSHC